MGGVRRATSSTDDAYHQTFLDSVPTVTYGVSSADDIAAVVANFSYVSFVDDMAKNADEYYDVSSGGEVFSCDDMDAVEANNGDLASGDDVTSKDPIEDVQSEADVIVLSCDDSDDDCDVNITSINLTFTNTDKKCRRSTPGHSDNIHASKIKVKRHYAIDS